MAAACLGAELHRLATDGRWADPAATGLDRRAVLPPLTALNLSGLIWLGLIGAGATYAIWFRGIARLEPGAVSMLGMMSPVTAVSLGWLWLGQGLSLLQMSGAAIVLISVWAGQRANRPQVAHSFRASRVAQSRAA